MGKRWLAALAALVFSAAGGAAAGEDVIRIGVSAPITGNYAEYGENFRYSAQMAAKLINESGGLLGRKVEAVVMDSKGDPKEAALIAQKMVEDPGMAAEVGDFTSTCCLAAAPIFERAGMVQLSPTSSHPDFAPSGRYMFGIIGTQAAECPFNVQYTALEYLGAASVAIIYINNDWGQVTKDEFTKACRKFNLPITGVELFMEAERDHGAILNKLRQTNPDALFIISHYNEAAAICRQIRRMNWKVKKFSPSSIFSVKMIELGGEAAEGIATNTLFALEDPNPKVRAFIAEFNKAAGRDPNMHAACAYDSFLMVGDAIKRAGTTDRAAIRDALAATRDFDGVTGKLTFTEAGDINRKYMVMVIENGKWVVKKDYTK
ncbi:MAG: ABC transporter substrate-binding protein [Planctomycetota bacterium]|jgi:branched-chain amino acid transport system substrate-binding protein|nr:ABC transporter substrate-binding protein [Planctomycetota bacterium]